MYLNSINCKTLFKLEIKLLGSHVELETMSYLGPNYILLSQTFLLSVVQFCLDPMPVKTRNTGPLYISLIKRIH